MCYTLYDMLQKSCYLTQLKKAPLKPKWISTELLKRNFIDDGYEGMWEYPTHHPDGYFVADAQVAQAVGTAATLLCEYVKAGQVVVVVAAYDQHQILRRVMVSVG